MQTLCFSNRVVCVASAVLAGIMLVACSGGNATPGFLSSGGGPMLGGPGPAVETEFTTDGRFIDWAETVGAQSASRRSGGAEGVKVFVKGMVYSPTPIGAFPFDSPLKDSNSPIWSRDLPLMRAMGVNMIHVYNVTPPPYDGQTGPIFDFLNSAWNNGNNPIYVVMSIFFTGDKLLNQNAVNALAQQYHDLDKKYAKYPAVFGTSIGNEIGDDQFIGNPAWWKAFNQIATAAKQGFKDGGDANKIVTTSERDGNIGSLVAGEKNGAAIDVWGVNIYRGRTFTNLFAQIRAATKKPVILTEYGASAAYHPMTKDKYDYNPSDKNALASCTKGGGSTSITDVAELPTTSGSNPNMAGLTDLITNTTSLMYDGFTGDGVVSGGFYFEWADEWWKANQGNANIHYGNVAFNGGFPGCNEDQGWYGLNSVGAGTPNTLTPRPTLAALKKVWAGETSIP